MSHRANYSLPPQTGVAVKLMSLEKIVFSLPNPPPKWHPSFNLVHTEQRLNGRVWTRCLENQNISGSHQIINNSNQQKCQFTVREYSSLHLKCRHLFQTSGSKAGKKYRDARNKCTENKLFHSHVCEIKEMHDTQEWMRLTGLYCFYHLDERCPRSAKQDIHS